MFKRRLFVTALSLSALLLAHTSLAAPIIVNLIPNGNKDDKIEVPLEAVELSQTLKDNLADMGTVTEGMRKDTKKYVVDFDVHYRISKRTLSAIANALMAMQNLQRSKKEITFSKLKTIITTFCFPPKDPATSDDILDFLVAANFLDIHDLLRPAAAALIDKTQYSMLQIVTALRVHKPEIPKDLTQLFYDYHAWRVDPTSLIKPVTLPVQVSKPTRLYGALEMVAAHNKLYMLDSEHSEISVFDLKEKALKTSILGSNPRDMVVKDNNLYVTNEGNDTISVFDVATDSPIGSPIAVGSHPWGLAVSDTELFAANSVDKTISVIDMANNKTISQIDLRMVEALAGQTKIRSLAVTANKLYVSIFGLGSNYSNTVLVIDLATHKFVRSIKVGSLPDKFAVFGNKLYVINIEDKTVSVIDVTNDKVIGSPIALRGYFSHAAAAHFAEAVVGNVLFVSDAWANTIWAIDTKTDKVIGKPIEVQARPEALAVSSSKLYVRRQSGVDELDLAKFLYYNK